MPGGLGEAARWHYCRRILVLNPLFQLASNLITEVSSGETYFQPRRPHCWAAAASASCSASPLSALAVASASPQMLLILGTKKLENMTFAEPPPFYRALFAYSLAPTPQLIACKQRFLRSLHVHPPKGVLDIISEAAGGCRLADGSRPGVCPSLQKATAKAMTPSSLIWSAGGPGRKEE